MLSAANIHEINKGNQGKERPLLLTQFQKSYHETASKDATKKLQEILLSNIILAYFPCNYYSIIFYSLTLFSAGFS